MMVRNTNVQQKTEPTEILELDDGLILRRAKIKDRERLADLNAVADGPPGQPNEELRRRTLEMMRDDNPDVGPHCFTVVEDTTRGHLVSSLCLLAHRWSYSGVEFDVGRIELVNTHRDYRNQGLVRAQITTVHDWARSRGDKVTVIFGMPWFYRQFGYEMALAFGGNRRMVIGRTNRSENGITSHHIRAAKRSDLPVHCQNVRIELQ